MHIFPWDGVWIYVNALHTGCLKNVLAVWPRDFCGDRMSVSGTCSFFFQGTFNVYGRPESCLLVFCTVTSASNLSVNGAARGWRFCEFPCETALHFSCIFGLPITFQDKLSIFETKCISFHGLTNLGYLKQKKNEYIHNGHQVESFWTWFFNYICLMYLKLFNFALCS